MEDELRELCLSGEDVKLQDASAWEELDLAIAKQILEEHFYVQDPNDPSLFVQSSGAKFAKRTQYAMAGPESNDTSLILPGSIPKIKYSEPSTLTSDDKPRCRVIDGSDNRSWRPCHCIQIDTRVYETIDQLRIAVPEKIQHSCREQRVATVLVIEPSVRSTPANLDVLLRIKTLFVGVFSADVIKNEAALGFYPVRIKLSIEPQLGDSRTVAIPLYTSVSGMDQGGSTRTRTSDTKIGAQIGFGPVTISGERSWGMEVEESREREMVITGEMEEQGAGNTAVFEWRLLRWSHNGMSYNANKPHSGISWSTRSLKAPFPGGNTGVKVDSFPEVMWHLHPSMSSKFPLEFKLHLEVEMHVLWFVGKNRLFRVAEWRQEAFQFVHQFSVSDGINSAVV